MKAFLLASYAKLNGIELMMRLSMSCDTMSVSYHPREEWWFEGCKKGRRAEVMEASRDPILSEASAWR
jgi:hypothetical protein